jgi:hypothetical protein
MATNSEAKYDPSSKRQIKLTNNILINIHFVNPTYTALSADN